MMAPRLHLRHLPPPTSPPPPPPQPRNPNHITCRSTVRSSATKPGPGGGRPRWDSNAETIRTGRFQFDEDNYGADFRGEDSVGFGGTRTRRKWWSDEGSNDDDEDEDEEGFGFWDESRGIDWISKLLGALGWMLPAVIISMLMGTPNTLIMALVLPLGQSAISLVVDKLWGDPGYRPRPRSKTKGDPFARGNRGTKPRDRRREESTGTRQRPESYQTWASMNDGTGKSGGRGRMNFGGWDELDKQGAGSGNVFQGKVQDGRADDDLPRQQTNGKLSRRRNRERPLFLRLLMAVFPFLGSWTRLFM